MSTETLPICTVCHSAFIANNMEPPPTCGRINCRSRHEWSDDDYVGRARMARSRRAAGVVLDDLDLLALDRVGGAS